VYYPDETVGRELPAMSLIIEEFKRNRSCVWKKTLVWLDYNPIHYYYDCFSPFLFKCYL